VFLLSAWKKERAGGAGRRQFIFQPWTPPCPSPLEARPLRGDRDRPGLETTAAVPVFYKEKILYKGLKIIMMHFFKSITFLWIHPNSGFLDDSDPYPDPGFDIESTRLVEVLAI
jgi:hypothetical protein